MPEPLFASLGPDQAPEGVFPAVLVMLSNEGGVRLDEASFRTVPRRARDRQCSRSDDRCPSTAGKM
jgi:hypothetical protein